MTCLRRTTNKDPVKEGHLKGKTNLFQVAPLERFTIKFTAKRQIQGDTFVNVMNSKLVNVITVKGNLVTWYELKFDVCRKRDSKSLHWDTGKSLKRYL